MAKDFFQDIVPPSHGDNAQRPAGAGRKVRLSPPPAPHAAPFVSERASQQEASSFESDDDIVSEEDAGAPQSRGIRNINMPTRPRYRNALGEIGETAAPARQAPRRSGGSSSGKWILWALVLACILVAGFLATFMFRQSTVTITPRSQNITFDQTAQFIAYPSSSSATGTLAYTVAATDLSGSETVAGNGTTATQSKASGTITVYNNYSTASVKLIKNTRFESPAGLIFRTPTDIVVPGKQGSNPGSVTATVQADQTGPQYNVAPDTKFTIPGLQSNAAMYAGMYAQSTAGISGGSSGTQEGVAESVRQAAIADIHAQLTQKAAEFVKEADASGTIAFPGLTEISFSDAPDADATSSQVIITENAHVSVPVFQAQAFAAAVAQTMAVDTNGVPITLIGGSGYAAQPTDTTPVNLGTDPVDFSMVGSAQILWSVDTGALVQALAGRDQASFQTIIAGFPGIQSAKARIEPFWKNSFPSDPSSIKVIVESPATSSAGQAQ